MLNLELNFDTFFKNIQYNQLYILIFARDLDDFGPLKLYKSKYFKCNIKFIKL